MALCGAHGFEQMAAHRPWRALAHTLTTAGCPTLRFDDPGEGNSADHDAPRVPACVAAIGRSVRLLREIAGFDEVAALRPELQPAEHLWHPVDEPIDNRLVAIQDPAMCLGNLAPAVIVIGVGATIAETPRHPI